MPPKKTAVSGSNVSFDAAVIRDTTKLVEGSRIILENANIAFKGLIEAAETLEGTLSRNKFKGVRDGLVDLGSAFDEFPKMKRKMEDMTAIKDTILTTKAAVDGMIGLNDSLVKLSGELKETSTAAKGVGKAVDAVVAAGDNADMSKVGKVIDKISKEAKSAAKKGKESNGATKAQELVSALEKQLTSIIETLGNIPERIGSKMSELDNIAKQIEGINTGNKVAPITDAITAIGRVMTAGITRQLELLEGGSKDGSKGINYLNKALELHLKNLGLKFNKAEAEAAIKKRVSEITGAAELQINALDLASSFNLDWGALDRAIADGIMGVRAEATNDAVSGNVVNNAISQFIQKKLSGMSQGDDGEPDQAAIKKLTDQVAAQLANIAAGVQKSIDALAVTVAGLSTGKKAKKVDMKAFDKSLRDVVKNMFVARAPATKASRKADKNQKDGMNITKIINDQIDTIAKIEILGPEEIKELQERIKTTLNQKVAELNAALSRLSVKSFDINSFKIDLSNLGVTMEKMLSKAEVIGSSVDIGAEISVLVKKELDRLKTQSKSTKEIERLTKEYERYDAEYRKAADAYFDEKSNTAKHKAFIDTGNVKDAARRALTDATTAASPDARSRANYSDPIVAFLRKSISEEQAAIDALTIPDLGVSIDLTSLNLKIQQSLEAVKVVGDDVTDAMNVGTLFANKVDAALSSIAKQAGDSIRNNPKMTAAATSFATEINKEVGEALASQLENLVKSSSVFTGDIVKYSEGVVTAINTMIRSFNLTSTGEVDFSKLIIEIDRNNEELEGKIVKGIATIKESELNLPLIQGTVDMLRSHINLQISQVGDMFRQINTLYNGFLSGIVARLNKEATAFNTNNSGVAESFASMASAAAKNAHLIEEQIERGIKLVYTSSIVNVQSALEAAGDIPEADMDLIKLKITKMMDSIASLTLPEMSSTSNIDMGAMNALDAQYTALIAFLRDLGSRAVEINATAETLTDIAPAVNLLREAQKNIAKLISIKEKIASTFTTATEETGSSDAVYASLKKDIESVVNIATLASGLSTISIDESSSEKFGKLGLFLVELKALGEVDKLVQFDPEVCKDIQLAILCIGKSIEKINAVPALSGDTLTGMANFALILKLMGKFSSTTIDLGAFTVLESAMLALVNAFAVPGIDNAIDVMGRLFKAFEGIESKIPTKYVRALFSGIAKAAAESSDEVVAAIEAAAAKTDRAMNAIGSRPRKAGAKKGRADVEGDGPIGIVTSQTTVNTNLVDKTIVGADAVISAFSKTRTASEALARGINTVFDSIGIDIREVGKDMDDTYGRVIPVINQFENLQGQLTQIDEMTIGSVFGTESALTKDINTLQTMLGVLGNVYKEHEKIAKIRDSAFVPERLGIGGGMTGDIAIDESQSLGKALEVVRATGKAGEEVVEGMQKMILESDELFKQTSTIRDAAIEELRIRKELLVVTKKNADALRQAGVISNSQKTQQVKELEARLNDASSKGGGKIAAKEFAGIQRGLQSAFGKTLQDSSGAIAKLTGRLAETQDMISKSSGATQSNLQKQADALQEQVSILTKRELSDRENLDRAKANLELLNRVRKMHIEINSISEKGSKSVSALEGVTVGSLASKSKSELEELLKHVEVIESAAKRLDDIVIDIDAGGAYAELSKVSEIMDTIASKRNKRISLSKFLGEDHAELVQEIKDRADLADISSRHIDMNKDISQTLSRGNAVLEESSTVIRALITEHSQLLNSDSLLASGIDNVNSSMRALTDSAKKQSNVVANTLNPITAQIAKLEQEKALLSATDASTTKKRETIQLWINDLNKLKSSLEANARVLSVDNAEMSTSSSRIKAISERLHELDAAIAAAESANASYNPSSPDAEKDLERIIKLYKQARTLAEHLNRKSFNENTPPAVQGILKDKVGATQPYISDSIKAAQAELLRLQAISKASVPVNDAAAKSFDKISNSIKMLSQSPVGDLGKFLTDLESSGKSTDNLHLGFKLLSMDISSAISQRTTLITSIEKEIRKNEELLKTTSDPAMVKAIQDRIAAYNKELPAVRAIRENLVALKVVASESEKSFNKTDKTAERFRNVSEQVRTATDKLKGFIATSRANMQAGAVQAPIDVVSLNEARRALSNVKSLLGDIAKAEATVSLNSSSLTDIERRRLDSMIMEKDALVDQETELMSVMGIVKLLNQQTNKTKNDYHDIADIIRDMPIANLAIGKNGSANIIPSGSGGGGSGGNGGSGGGSGSGGSAASIALMDQETLRLVQMAKARIEAMEAAKIHAVDTIREAEAVKALGMDATESRLALAAATRETTNRSKALKLGINIIENSIKAGRGEATVLKEVADKMRESVAGTRELAAAGGLTSQAVEKFTSLSKSLADEMAQTINMQMKQFASFTLLYGATNLARSSITRYIEETRSLGIALSASRSGTDNLEQRLSILQDTMGTLRMEFGSSTEDIGAAMYQIGSAGLNLNQTLGAMEPLMQLIVGTGSEANEMGKTLASTMNVLASQGKTTGDSFADFAHVGDVIAATFRDNQMEIAEFTNALKYTLPVAHQVGISFEELAALLGSLHTQGIKAGNAGRQLRALFFNIAQNREIFQSAFSDIGVEIDPAKSLDFMNILQQVGAGLRDQSISVARLKKILQSLGMRATGPFLLMAEGIDLVNQNLQLTKEQALGANAALADVKIDRLATQIDKMNQAMYQLIITALKPTLWLIELLVGWFNNAAESIVSVNKAMGGLLAYGAMGVGIIISLGVAVGAVVSVVATAAGLLVFLSDSLIKVGFASGITSTTMSALAAAQYEAAISAAGVAAAESAAATATAEKAAIDAAAAAAALAAAEANYVQATSTLALLGAISSTTPAEIANAAANVALADSAGIAAAAMVTQANAAAVAAAANATAAATASTAASANIALGGSGVVASRGIFGMAGAFGRLSAVFPAIGAFLLSPVGLVAGFVIIVAAIAAVGVGIYKFIDYMQSAEKATSDLNDKINESTLAIQGINEAATEKSKFTATANKLLSDYEKYNKVLTSTAYSAQEMARAQNELNNVLVQAAASPEFGNYVSTDSSGEFKLNAAALRDYIASINELENASSKSKDIQITKDRISGAMDLGNAFKDLSRAYLVNMSKGGKWVGRISKDEIKARDESRRSLIKGLALLKMYDKQYGTAAVNNHKFLTSIIKDLSAVDAALNRAFNSNTRKAISIVNVDDVDILATLTEEGERYGVVVNDLIKKTAALEEFTSSIADGQDGFTGYMVRLQELSNFGQLPLEIESTMIDTANQSLDRLTRNLRLLSQTPRLEPGKGVSVLIEGLSKEVDDFYADVNSRGGTLTFTDANIGIQLAIRSAIKFNEILELMGKDGNIQPLVNDLIDMGNSFSASEENAEKLLNSVSKNAIWLESFSRAMEKAGHSIYGAIAPARNELELVNDSLANIADSATQTFKSKLTEAGIDEKSISALALRFRKINFKTLTGAQAEQFAAMMQTGKDESGEDVGADISGMDDASKTKAYQAVVEVLNTIITKTQRRSDLEHDIFKTQETHAMAMIRINYENAKSLGVGAHRLDQINYELGMRQAEFDLIYRTGKIEDIDGAKGIARREAEAKLNATNAQLEYERLGVVRELNMSYMDGNGALLETIEQQRTLPVVFKDMISAYNKFVDLGTERNQLEISNADIIAKAGDKTKEAYHIQAQMLVNDQQRIEKAGQLLQFYRELADSFEEMNNLYKEFLSLQRDIIGDMSSAYQEKLDRSSEGFRSVMESMASASPILFAMKSAMAFGELDSSIFDTSSTIDKMVAKLTHGGIAAGDMFGSFGSGVNRLSKEISGYSAKLKELQSREADITKTMARFDINMLQNLMKKGIENFSFDDLTKAKDLISSIIGYSRDLGKTDPTTGLALYNVLDKLTGKFAEVTAVQRDTFMLKFGIDPSEFYTVLDEMTKSVTAFIEEINRREGIGLNIYAYGFEDIKMNLGKVFTSAIEEAVGKLNILRGGKKPDGFATGGSVPGGSSARGDVIPAMLTPGEFVIPAEVVRKIGADKLYKLINGSITAGQYTELMEILSGDSYARRGNAKGLRRNEMSYFDYMNRQEDLGTSLTTSLSGLGKKYGLPGFNRGGFVGMTAGGTGADAVNGRRRNSRPIKSFNAFADAAVATFDVNISRKKIQDAAIEAAEIYNKTFTDEASRLSGILDKTDIDSAANFEKQFREFLEKSMIVPFFDTTIKMREMFSNAMSDMLNETLPFAARIAPVMMDAITTGIADAAGGLVDVFSGVLSSLFDMSWMPYNEKVVDAAANAMDDVKKSYEDGLGSLVKQLRRNEISYFQYLNNLEDLNEKYQDDMANANKADTAKDPGQDLFADRIKAIVDAVQAGFATIASTFADTITAAFTDAVKNAASNASKDITGMMITGFTAAQGAIAGMFGKDEASGSTLDSISRLIGKGSASDANQKAKLEGGGISAIKDYAKVGTEIAGLMTDMIGIVVGIGTVIASIGGMMSNLTTEGVSTFFGGGSDANGNKMPSVYDTINGVVKQFVTEIPAVMEIIAANAGPLLDAMIAAVQEVIPIIMDAAMSFIDTLIKNMPKIIELLSVAVQNIMAKLPELIPMLGELLSKAIEGLLEIIVNDIVPKLGQIVSELIKSLFKIAGMIAAQLVPIMLGIISQIPEIIGGIVSGAILFVAEIIKGIPDIIAAVIKMIPQIIIALVKAIAGIGVSLVSGVADAVSGFGKSVGKWVDSIFGGSDDKKPQKKMSDLLGSSKSSFGYAEMLKMSMGSEKGTEQLIAQIKSLAANGMLTAEQLSDYKKVVEQKELEANGLARLGLDVNSQQLDELRSAASYLETIASNTSLEERERMYQEALAMATTIRQGELGNISAANISNETIARIITDLERMGMNNTDIMSLLKDFTSSAKAQGLSASKTQALWDEITTRANETGLSGQEYEAVIQAGIETQKLIASIERTGVDIGELPLDTFMRDYNRALDRLMESVASGEHTLEEARSIALQSALSSSEDAWTQFAENARTNYAVASSEGDYEDPLLNSINDSINKFAYEMSGIFQNLSNAAVEVRAALGESSSSTANRNATSLEDAVVVRHRGGMIVAHNGYLAHDERMAILQTGEGVLNRRAIRAMGEDTFNLLNSGIPIDSIFKMSARKFGEGVIASGRGVATQTRNSGGADESDTSNSATEYNDNREDHRVIVNFNNCTFQGNVNPDEIEKKLVSKWKNRSGQLQNIIRNNRDNTTDKNR